MSAKFELKKVMPWAVVIVLLWSLVACESAYYTTMEQFGYHKRDLMVSRVEDARDAQQEAKEQFESALEQFSSVLQFDGGRLEEKYKQLKSEYDSSEAKAENVRDRIDAVEDVAEDLFAEWQEELDQYHSSGLRRSSERKLKATRKKYAQLISAMKRAEQKMEPVLVAFHDQVLYLKHNLNAQAISSLQSELVNVEADVASLIRDMEISIKEADTFIDSLATE
jgi:Skp family chaperone for outer membrane proteins